MRVKCPICSGRLEERDVAPCYDCGHVPGEVGEFQRGEHEYHVFAVFGQQVVLCDFCDADFGSYYPEYFGLPPGPPRDLGDPLELIAKVEQPKLARDSYCDTCRHRLAFLDFLQKARAHNSGRH